MKWCREGSSSCFPISAIRKKQWIWNDLPLPCCVCAFFQMHRCNKGDLTRVTIREDELLKRESHHESWEGKEKVHVLQRRRSFRAKAAKMKSYPGVCFPFFFLLSFILQSEIQAEVFYPEETSENIYLLTRSSIFGNLGINTHSHCCHRLLSSGAFPWLVKRAVISGDHHTRFWK